MNCLSSELGLIQLVWWLGPSAGMRTEWPGPACPSMASGLCLWWLLSKLQTLRTTTLGSDFILTMDNHEIYKFPPYDRSTSPSTSFQGWKVKCSVYWWGIVSSKAWPPAKCLYIPYKRDEELKLLSEKLSKFVWLHWAVSWVPVPQNLSWTCSRMWAYNIPADVFLPSRPQSIYGCSNTINSKGQKQIAVVFELTFRFCLTRGDWRTKSSSFFLCYPFRATAVGLHL